MPCIALSLVQMVKRLLVAVEIKVLPYCLVSEVVMANIPLLLKKPRY